MIIDYADSKGRSSDRAAIILGMELRDHLIGPCAIVDEEDRIEVDIGALVRRLILFERYTLRTIRLREVPALVRAFGEGGLRALLADGCLDIFCEALTMAQSSPLLDPGSIPPGAMQFSSIRSSDQRQYLSTCLREVNGISALSQRQVKDLKLALVDSVVRIDGAGDLATAQMDKDLSEGAPVLADGVALALRDLTGTTVDPTEIRLDVESHGEGVVVVQSNLTDLAVVEDTRVHDVLERGLLSVGGLNIRIELMKRLEGISGCERDELPLFVGKMDSLMAQLDPDSQEERFLRVQTLAELPEPDLSRSPAIDVDALLDARALPEARALRGWLRGVGDLSDAEITESFHAVREALGRAAHSTGGKAVRLAVNTAVGLAPGGALISAGLGALDSFLLDRVIAEPGPYSFLSHTWPSLFEGS
jgi:hypothetical protein